MSDAITMLREDHRAVEKLFKSFQKAGPNALKTKARLVHDMIRELTIHASIEEQIFYPTVREDAQDLDSDILEALEEHHVVKWLLSKLNGLDPSAERFDAKVAVLIDSVRHHVSEEEGELFPAVRQAFSRQSLVAMGDALAAAKKGAPTKPAATPARRTAAEPPCRCRGGGGGPGRRGSQESRSYPLAAVPP